MVQKEFSFSTHADVFPNVAHRGLDGAVILVQPLSFALGDGYDGDNDNVIMMVTKMRMNVVAVMTTMIIMSVMVVVMQRLMQPLRQPLSFAPKSS